MKRMLRLSTVLLLLPASLSAESLSKKVAVDPQGPEEKFVAVAKASITR